MKKEYDEIFYEYTEKKQTPFDDEYIGDNWSVREEKERYYFTYISGELAGKLKEIEISQEDFKFVKERRLTFDELCIKYNVS